MWFEKIIKLLKTKGSLLSLRILFIPTFLMCLNPWRDVASAEADLLDPTLILTHQIQTKNVAEAKISAAMNNTMAVPDTKLKVGEHPETLPQCFSPDTRFLYFSTTDSQASSKEEYTEPTQPAPEQRQLTQKDELLKTSISSVTDNPNNQTRQTLGHLIEQISSMKIRPKTKEPQPESQPKVDEKEPINNAKQANKSTETETPAETEARQQPSTHTLNPEIVQKLERIIEQSAIINEPQLLADMLYQTGYYELAAYFYELAISHDTKKQMDDLNKSWLMMQKAVCLSNSNPQQALQIYKGLISQYPASPWVELAKNNEGLIDWLEAQQPKKLIEQCRQDLKAN